MRLSLWAWLFLTLPFYLALEVGPFLMIEWGLKKTVGELIGPYLAFALPAAIFLPLVWWLRVWEEQGTSPKRLARGWGLSMVLFGTSVIVAFFYSGIKLHFMASNDALGGFVVSMLLSVPISYFGMHQMVLTRISTRAATKSGGTEREK